MTAAPAGLTNFQSPATDMTRRRCADVLVDVIASTGAGVVFGLPGGTISPLHDALLDRPEIRVVTTRHEAGAVFAAAAYARRTGTPGFVLVTSGPGFFNALNGLASAWCDGLPIILLVGEVARANFGKRALQEGTSHHLDVVNMVKHLTKMAMQIPNGASAPAMLHAAIAASMTGPRGPSVLTLPVDVGLEPIDTPNLVTVNADDAIPDVTAAVAALNGARRGIILAGAGSHAGDGPSALIALAEHMQWPVACTPKGKGALAETHPLSLGVFGHGGHRATAEYLERGVDAVLVVGSSLGDPATDGWSPLLRCQVFVQIDWSYANLGRNYPVSHALLGPCAPIMRAIATKLAPRRNVEHFGFGRAALAETSAEAVMSPKTALEELQRQLPENTIYNADIGEHLMFATHFIAATYPGQLGMMNGLGSMGTSIPAAYGCALAEPSRTAVAICGDGCFVMSLPDVVTASAEHLPIVIAVLNDFRYNMVEQGHEQVYGRRPSYPAGPIDIAELARAAGAKAYTIRRAEDFTQVQWPPTENASPVVLDIHIDAHVRLPKGSRNQTLAAKTDASR